MFGWTANSNRLGEVYKDLAGATPLTPRGGTIGQFCGGNVSGGSADPGQNRRGAPDLMRLWTILQVSPEGSGTDPYRN